MHVCVGSACRNICVCVCVCITTGYCKSHVVALMFVIFCQNLSHEGAFQPWEGQTLFGCFAPKVNQEFSSDSDGSHSRLQVHDRVQL